MLGDCSAHTSWQRHYGREYWEERATDEAPVEAKEDPVDEPEAVSERRSSTVEWRDRRMGRSHVVSIDSLFFLFTRADPLISCRFRAS
jgi:hypothetical protein